MYHWQLTKIKLPLKFSWKIASGEASEKEIYLVKVRDGDHHANGEAAGITKRGNGHPYEEYFKSIQQSDIKNIEDLLAFDLPTPLKFAMSSALNHLECAKQGKSLEELLGTKKVDTVKTSYAIPILPLGEIAAFMEKYDLHRFSSIKVKVANEDPAARVKELAQVYKGPIRVDANEAFTSATGALAFIESIQDLNVEFIEQPMDREANLQTKTIKDNSPFPILADESVQDSELSEDMAQCFDGINVKLMKAGSYQMALKQLKQAKAWGMKTMLGCMVETSLGISGAMAIADGVDYFDLDGFLYFADEPFRLVTEDQGLISQTLSNHYANS